MYHHEKKSTWLLSLYKLVTKKTAKNVYDFLSVKHERRDAALINQPSLDGFFHQSRGIFYVQFLIDVVAVRFHRSERDEKFTGNLLARQTFGI